MVTIDTLAPLEVIPGFNQYSQVAPPGGFALQVADLTLPSDGAGIVQINTASPSARKLEMVFPFGTLTTPGWSYTLSQSATQPIVGSFGTVYPVGLPTELSQLDLNALFASFPPVGHLRLQAGEYTYPGGSATILDGSFPDILLDITSFTIVPEPSMLSLAVLAFFACCLADRCCKHTGRTAVAP